MRKKPVQLAVPQPCSESRKNMKKTQEGYFCHSCNSDVVDYRGYSDQAMLESLKRRKAEGKPCGIFRDDQLNRNLHPAGQSCRPFSHTWKALGLLTGLSLAPQVNSLLAQSGVSQPEMHHFDRTVTTPESQSQSQKTRYLTGQVTDRFGREPLKRVKIRFEECGQTVRTNADGRFKLVVPQNYTGEHLTVMVSESRHHRSYSKKILTAALPVEGLKIKLIDDRYRVTMGCPAF